MNLKIWLIVLRRKLFGLKEFNRKEVAELVELYNTKQLNAFYFRIFERVRSLSKPKYDFISEELYYNLLAPKMASVYSYEKIQNKNMEGIYDTILTAKIRLEVILDAIEDSYQKGQTP